MPTCWPGHQTRSPATASAWAIRTPNAACRSAIRGREIPKPAKTNWVYPSQLKLVVGLLPEPYGTLPTNWAAYSSTAAPL